MTFLYILTSELALANTASFMLSVTWLAFFRFSLYSTGSARLFWLHLSFSSRHCSINLAVGVGRWNSARLPDNQISILQCAVKLLKCWDRETEGNTKKFLTPCRAQTVNTKKRKEEDGRCDPEPFLPMPWEAGLVLLPLFAGQLFWPLLRALLPKPFSSSTFPFTRDHHLRL